MTAGQWAADPGARGAGRLQVIKLSSGGLAWYFRYTRPDGKRDALPLGTELTLAEARSAAGQLSRRYQAGERDLRAILDNEQLALEKVRREVEDSENSAKKLAAGTLGVLLTAYCDHLDRAKKESASNVRNALVRHVERPWPHVWSKPASQVDADELLQVVARLVHVGKLREAAKLRSYVRAAYAAAISARHDPAALPQLRDLKLSSNPARDLATIEGNTQSGERNLSIAELRSYWKHINAPELHYGPLLRFHLLTGAQRIAQLSRATLADLDLDTNALRLYDRKGRRKRPREHDVPLLPEALVAMAAMGGGPYLFTLSGGATPAGSSGMGDAVDAANQLMSRAAELPGGRFTPRDLRRTVETRLSAAGVSLEDRGYLQSHGLGGVQARHYDRHKRVNEARAALRTLLGLLEP